MEPIPAERVEVDLLRAAEFYAEQGMEIYLTLRPNLPFVALQNTALTVADQDGRNSPRCCFGNSRIVSYLKKHVSDAIRMCRDTIGDKLRGVAIDVVDLWPMGAWQDRILVTCFCHECRARLARSPENVNAEWFRSDPSPLNLVLADTGTGISYVDNITPDTSPEEIVQLSLRSREFLARRWFLDNKLDSERERLLDYAAKLKRYTDAQSRMTRDIIRELWDAFKSVDQSLRRVLICEWSDYNWTAGLYSQEIDTQDLTDEIWTDLGPDMSPPSRVEYRPYLAHRSRYFIDALFDVLGAVQDSSSIVMAIGRPRDDLVKLLKAHVAQAVGRVYTTLLPMGGMHNRLRPVAVSLDDHLGTRLQEVAEIPDIPIMRPRRYPEDDWFPPREAGPHR